MTRLQHLTVLRDKVKAGECQNSWNAIERAAEWSAVGLENTGKAVCAYNGSLDAAKALHDSLLPGWIVAMASCGYVSGDEQPTAMVCPRTDLVDDRDAHEGKSDTMARAWLLAILEALIAQEGGE